MILILPVMVLTLARPSIAMASRGYMAILVSSSIPVQTLQSYCQQAKQYDATLVLRGLKDNSLQATTTWIARNKLGDCPWQIEPRLYSQLNIRHVPVGLYFADDLKPGDVDENLPAYARVDGNISLLSMCDYFKQQGLPCQVTGELR